MLEHKRKQTPNAHAHNTKKTSARRHDIDDVATTRPATLHHLSSRMHTRPTSSGAFAHVEHVLRFHTVRTARRITLYASCKEADGINKHMLFTARAIPPSTPRVDRYTHFRKLCAFRSHTGICIYFPEMCYIDYSIYVVFADILHNANWRCALEFTPIRCSPNIDVCARARVRV